MNNNFPCNGGFCFLSYSQGYFFWLYCNQSLQSVLSIKSIKALYYFMLETPIEPKQVASPVRSTFEQYQDPAREFDSQTLKYGMWYVTHRLALYQALVFGLIVISLGLFGFAGWRGWQEVNVALNDQGRFNKNLRTFPDYAQVNPHFTPLPLQIVNSVVFAGGTDKYDLVAEITNPNPRFLVSFDYSFVVNGQTTPAEHTVLLPGEHRPVATLGLTSATYPNAPELVMQQVAWQRISNHRVLDTAPWQAERLNFGVTDFGFTGQGGGADSAIVSFALTNNTPYGYVAPRFYVGLYNQDSLVGLLPLTLGHFPSLAVQKIDVRSLTPNLSVSDIKVFPIINVYDNEVYLDPEK